jgi:D-arginine dehydrogenase
MITADVLILGAGIAGASLAAELATDRRVVVLEIEDRPGRHATGRSAATFAQNYGNPIVRALTRASREFFDNPPDVFGSSPLLRRRGALFVADVDRVDHLDRLLNASANQGGLERLDPREILDRCPILRPDWIGGGLADDSVLDLDVGAIHQGFLRGAREAGVQLFVDAHPTQIYPRTGAWHVETTRGDSFVASVLVNATGAWADEVARAAGVIETGLQPMRRTCLLLAAPVAEGFAEWPMVIDVDEQAYFKPESGMLLLSPANEDVSSPCDAVPDELDVAIAVDRFERMTTVGVSRIAHRWAGLRSFVPDRSPVVGFDPQAEGFFWLAGQGGYGIQTAPALARVAAALLRHEAMPADIEAEGLTLADLDPGRLG